jgi:hypothetical protein
MTLLVPLPLPSLSLSLTMMNGAGYDSTLDYLTYYDVHVYYYHVNVVGGIGQQNFSASRFDASMILSPVFFVFSSSSLSSFPPPPSCHQCIHLSSFCACLSSLA